MPENPAGSGYEPEKLVHPTKTATSQAPYRPFYWDLREKLGWKPTGVWHLRCRNEVVISPDGGSEACGCGTSDLDLAISAATQKEELPITKLI
jgi:hypothetical protein